MIGYKILLLQQFFLPDTSTASVTSMFLGISNRNWCISWHHIIVFPIPFIYSIIYGMSNIVF